MFRFSLLKYVNTICDGVYSDKRLNKNYLDILEKSKEIDSHFKKTYGVVFDSGFSIGSLKRWSKKLYSSDFKLDSLIPNNSKKGNRERRLPVELESLIREKCELINNDSNYTATKAWNELIEAIKKINIESGLDLPEITLQSFYLRYRKISPYQKKVNELGKFRADKEFRQLKSGQVLNRILEVVEIDHTILDIHLIDEDTGTVVGRPTITIVVDVYSKSILGFYIGFMPPSLLTVKKALKHAILPKTYVKEKYPQIVNEWFCHGLPELITSDNGKEFDADNLEGILADLLVNFKKNPTASPWYKGTVERVIGVINKRFLSGKEGSTNAFKIGDSTYKPEKRAAHTLTNFVEEFHKFVIDDYQVSTKNYGMIVPNVEWLRSSQMFCPRPFYLNNIDLDFILLARKTVTLSNHGVFVNYLRYNSEAISNIYQKIGKHSTEARFDEENLGFVFVKNIIDNTFIQVPAIHFEYASSISLLMHHEITNKKKIENKKYELNHKPRNLTYSKKEVSEKDVEINSALNNTKRSKIGSSKRNKRLKESLDAAREKNENIKNTIALEHSEMSPDDEIDIFIESDLDSFTLR